MQLESLVVLTLKSTRATRGVRGAASPSHGAAPGLAKCRGSVKSPLYLR